MSETINVYMDARTFLTKFKNGEILDYGTHYETEDGKRVVVSDNITLGTKQYHGPLSVYKEGL